MIITYIDPIILIQMQYITSIASAVLLIWMQVTQQVLVVSTGGTAQTDIHGNQIHMVFMGILVC